MVYLFKRQLDLDAQVGAAKHTTGCAATTAKTAEARAESTAKEVAKDTAEL